MTYILDSESGYALPANALRVAEIINDYNPSLELRWIPPAQRTSFDSKPYLIYHNLPSHPQGGYTVMFLGEDEMDHRVIARLWEMEDPDLEKKIERDEAAREVFKMKQRMEENEEAMEFALWALRSDKTVKHNGVVYC